MSWELEARSSSGGVAVTQGEVFILYDDWRRVEEGRGEVPEPVA